MSVLERIDSLLNLLTDHLPSTSRYSATGSSYIPNISQLGQNELKDEKYSEEVVSPDKQSYVTLKTKYSHGINVTKMPVVGLGTWLSTEGILDIIKYALDIGYRHIDGAAIYANEKIIGKALYYRIDNSNNNGRKINRKDVFITSKLWNTEHDKDDVLFALKQTLCDLRLDYIDLYLIHWPICFDRSDGRCVPFNDKGNDINYGKHVDILETWKELEKAVELGLVRHIGVSNFNSEQIERLMKNAKIKPSVLQCECHPYLNQQPLIDLCKKHNIIFTGYSPLGNPGRPQHWVKDSQSNVLEDDVLKKIAQKHNKSVAQICIRYQIERGVVVIPKSVHKDRVKSNLQVFDFKLSDEEIKQIDSLNCNQRTCVPLEKTPAGNTVAYDSKRPEYPFNIDF